MLCVCGWVGDYWLAGCFVLLDLDLMLWNFFGVYLYDAGYKFGVMGFRFGFACCALSGLLNLTFAFWLVVMVNSVGLGVLVCCMFVLY